MHIYACLDLYYIRTVYTQYRYCAQDHTYLKEIVKGFCCGHQKLFCSAKNRKIIDLYCTRQYPVTFLQNVYERL